MQSDTWNSNPGAANSRYRALFYVFDGGSGIGHLRRLSRIAAAMQERFSCLIVTGHDVGPQWIVPPGCEYVRLPAWDSILPAKAAYWGRAPFLDVDIDEAVHLRRSILQGVFEGFRPDVLLVDHLPLGAHNELASLVRHARCRKYLVTRGVQNETEDLQRLVLGGDALESLRTDYNRILSAIDPRVFDLSAHYGLPAEVTEKILPVGYVAPSPGQDTRAQLKAARGVGDGRLWVVASAGGGQWGEALIEACLKLSEQYDACFDIVMGPRSKLARPANNPEYLYGGRVRLHSSCPDLAAFHAAADLVVTTGGYNSLLESLRGQARILCVPYRKDPSDEPLRHASALKNYVDLWIEPEIEKLPAVFDQLIRRCAERPAQDRRALIDMNGAGRIAQIVFDECTAVQPQKTHSNDI